MNGHVFDHEAERKLPVSKLFGLATLIVIGGIGTVGWRSLHSNVRAAGAATGPNSAAQALFLRRTSLESRAETSALIDAAAAGNGELVDDLIRRGVDADSKDAAGRTALASAIASGETGIVRRLFSAGAKLSGGGELQLAAEHDDANLIELLLSAGASVDGRAKNMDDATALHIASECGHEHSVAALLKAKADIEVVDARGYTPLSRATLLGRGNVVQLLIQGGADARRADLKRRTALHFAAAVGDVDSLRALLNSKADAGAVDAYGWTALHYAAAHGRANLVPLLAKSMDHTLLDARTSRGATALHLAARRGEAACVAALLDAGLDASIRDSDGRSARDLAAADLNGEPWIRLGAKSKTQGARQPDPALLDCAVRRPKICICSRQARSLREPLVLLDLAIWEDGATVFAPWSASGSREYLAGVLPAAQLVSVLRDLDETGWLDSEAPKVDRTLRDCVELTLARNGEYQRCTWDEVERADLALDATNRAALADWSLGWARAGDVLDSARPSSTQAMSFVMVRGSFRGISFAGDPHAAWMD